MKRSKSNLIIRIQKRPLDPNNSVPTITQGEGTLRTELAGMTPVSLLLKESLIRGLWSRPTFLPTKKTRSPDGGRDREGRRTRFRITAPPWSSDSTWPCPMQTLRGHGGKEMQPFHVSMDPPAQAGHTDVPHPPPTHRCSSPAQGLRMLRLHLLLQRETGLASTQISTG